MVGRGASLDVIAVRWTHRWREPDSNRRSRSCERSLGWFDRLITRYDFADINRAAADATSGAAIKPVLLLPQ